MDSKTYALVRTLEVILTINPTGCGGAEKAFELAQEYANKGIKKYQAERKAELDKISKRNHPII